MTHLLVHIYCWYNSVIISGGTKGITLVYYTVNCFYSFVE